MTTTDTTIQALTTVITHWDDLRELVDTRAPASWPPVTPAEYAQLVQAEAADADAHAQQLVTIRHDSGQLYYACAQCDRVGEGHLHPVRADREPEQLGIRPDPLRLHILDTIRTVENTLLALADEIASEVQRASITTGRPSRLDPMQLDLVRMAAHDARDPARWRYNRGPRTAPAAAQWLRARVHDEPGPCAPLNDAQRELIHRIVEEAARRVEQLVGSARRHDQLHRACPSCRGALTLHHDGDEAPVVTCANGHDCAAPVRVIDGHRTWSTPAELAQLYVDLAAADRRVKKAAAKARQRDAARAS
ncbi:hypothetical protein [Streptomyces liangshanensis]|uniref:hypothetical protein n=1 Tax=Streptomyces liangshanensis TaxID=2717324 RepID=UPI0036D91A6B